MQQSIAWHQGFSDYFNNKECPYTIAGDSRIPDWKRGFQRAAQDDYEARINDPSHPPLEFEP